MTPTVSQIREQVKALLDHGADATAVGIYADRQHEWPPELTVDSRRFALRWCDSPLAVRLALHESRQSKALSTVILTPLTDHALGADVLARLSKGKVFRVKHWEILAHAFQARSVEGRLAQHGWIADLLIEHMPVQGYPPAPSGVLDAETAWRWLLQVTVGLGTARPDVETLLRWTSQPEGLTRLSALPERARTGIIDWLESVTGPAGHLVLGAVHAGVGLDALPLGVIAGMLVGETPPPELAAAAVRLERFTSGRRLDGIGARRWAEAAERVVREMERTEAQPFLERADSLLSDLYLRPFAELSRVLPSGFEARLAAFGQALEQFLGEASGATLALVEAGVTKVREHHFAPLAQARLERAEMATRLARWVAGATPKPIGFEAWIEEYTESGAYVDWARLKLLGGDQIATLSIAYNNLAEKVRVRQETANRSFAESLKGWNETGSTGIPAIPVERVLDELVAPLAKDRPVLLLVMDGLSLPVFAELVPDLGRLGWVSLRRDAGKWLGAAVAALPTVTEISRASLLSGRLTSGTQSAERMAFKQHSGMLGSARPSVPVLFHKGELGDGFGLSTDAREAVGNGSTRIVGVVYNAIDDQLDGATQIHLRWTLEDLRMLPALLHEARGSGRVLVLTADHGHVVENRTQQRPGQDGDRWRRPDGALGEGEIRIDGGRVLTPAGANSMVAPWTETIRYGAKKNGYHGGVSPQEVLVPLAVFAPSGMIVPGWVPMLPHFPDWWLGPTGGPTTRSPAPEPTVSGTKKTPAPQADLFTTPQPQPGDWIAIVLSSATYQTQKTLAARVAPADEDMRRLLGALSERGGKLSKTALAQRLNLPILRVSGFLSAARRVLNVDQSAVLIVDDTSGTVELNQSLLAVQFQTGNR